MCSHDREFLFETMRYVPYQRIGADKVPLQVCLDCGLVRMDPREVQRIMARDAEYRLRSETAAPGIFEPLIKP